MSKRIEQQNIFVFNLNKLQTYIWSLGYLITDGEHWRTADQQTIYVRTGRSKTMKSSHLDRMAADMNIFKVVKGEYILLTHEELKPIGEYWEKMNPKNRWGGSWRGLIESGKSTFKDDPHFEYFA